MRLFYSLFFTAVVAVEAASNEQNDGKNPKPEDVGFLLQESFEKLTDLYSEKKPNNKEELVRDSSNVLASFCAKHDFDCYENTFKLTSQEFQDAGNGPQEIHYPDNFDPKLMRLMEKVESALQQLNLENVDTVLEDLASTKTEIEGMNDVRDVDKETALIGMDVGLESVKLWHKVYSDPSHPLYGIHYPSHYFNTDNDKGENVERKLNDIDVAAITLTDFQAGLNRAMEKMSEGKDSMISAVARSFLARSIGRCGGGYYTGGYYTHHGSNHGTTTTTTTTTGHTNNHLHNYGYYYTSGHGTGTHGHSTTHAHDSTKHDSSTHHHHDGYYYHSGYYYSGHGNHAAATSTTTHTHGVNGTSHTHESVTGVDHTHAATDTAATGHTHGYYYAYYDKPLINGTSHTHGNTTHSHNYYYS